MVAARIPGWPATCTQLLAPTHRPRTAASKMLLCLQYIAISHQLQGLCPLFLATSRKQSSVTTCPKPPSGRPQSRVVQLAVEAPGSENELPRRGKGGCHPPGQRHAHTCVCPCLRATDVFSQRGVKEDTTSSRLSSLANWELF